MSFTREFLDDLRARVPVSAVVGRKVQLKKKGKEYVGLSPFQQEKTPSFHVIDHKKMWHDFSSGKNGDIFDFLTDAEGLDFVSAVAECCRLAGVPLPASNGRSDHSGPGEAPRTGGGLSARSEAPAERRDDARQPRNTEPRPTATYAYTDAQGALLYEVVRLEWIEDGERRKTFRQRRPDPAKEGQWIWNLEGVERTLYRLVELRETGAEEVVYFPEGEKDVATLAEWGLTATTVAGGTNGWRVELAEHFRGRDVVILIDNDDPGRKRGETIATDLHALAGRVRILDFSRYWDAAPKGADVTDWARAREGTVEEFHEILAQVPDWVPTRESRYGLVMWADQDVPGEEYEYLIEDLIPTGEAVLIIGESQSGKSFWTMDMGLALARGDWFFGRRVHKPFGVVYCAYEAGRGFKNRLQAYRLARGLVLEPLPFAVLTTPVNLWSDAVSTDALIDEIVWIARTKFRGTPLGAVVIDTHNRATAGASEIESKEVSTMIDRYSKIMRATGAGVWIIGHKNAAGKHRGNEQLYNNIETAIDISRQTAIVDKQVVPVRDSTGRVLRHAKVLKQREGAEGPIGDFLLAVKELGTNKYGRPRTSCVVEQVSEERLESDAERKAEAQAFGLSDTNTHILSALKDAITDFGVDPPPTLQLPRSILKVCSLNDWMAVYKRSAWDSSDDAVRKALKRANDKFIKLKIIGRKNPFVWLTGIKPRREQISEEPPPPSEAPPPSSELDLWDPTSTKTH